MRDEPRDPATAPTEDFENQLRSAGVTGELVVVGAESCRRRTISLPGLEPVGNEPGCSLSHTVSPDGLLAARCGYTVASIVDRRADRTLYQVPACPVSWRPDGVLTGVVGEEVLRFDVPCPETGSCSWTLIRRDELERAARRHPNVPKSTTESEIAADDLVWLTPTRAVLLLGIRLRGRLDGIGVQPQVAFFEAGRLRHTASSFRRDLAHLRASPSGRYVALSPGLVLRRDGSEVSLPRHLVAAPALAWSPDGRWLALAQRGNVVLVETESLERYDRTGSGLRTIALPLVVRDLVWR